MSVQTLRARLSRDDIERLVNQSDPEVRALAARKVCARIDHDGLTEAEREMGDQILRFLAQDAADLVRRALAVTLQRSTHLPHDVAVKLAADVESIAIPLISGSPVLEDADLIEIVRNSDAARQVAVASRESVSAFVVDEIVAVGAPEAVGTAAANDGADFTLPTFNKAVGRFSDDPSVLERFVDRTALPPEFTEKLISHISDTMIDRLITRHALPPQLAVELAEASRERATIDLVDQGGLAPDPRRFVQQMQMNGRLTPSFLLRTLFRGHMTLFEHCVAELASIDHAKAWLLIHDAGPLGLTAAFKQAGMPERILPAVRAAIGAWHSLEVGTGGAEDVAKFRKTLAERIFTQFQDAPIAELEYVLDRMDADQAAISKNGDRVAAAV
ncbi:DUF2336 domain-containing protein [Maricaulaceae bacterium EIL42A08]|nr:DUF2336 domain-containing protein [Maricaulaceae bacterium EIL42A08]